MPITASVLDHDHLSRKLRTFLSCFLNLVTVVFLIRVTAYLPGRCIILSYLIDWIVAPLF